MSSTTLRNGAAIEARRVAVVMLAAALLVLSAPSSAQQPAPVIDRGDINGRLDRLERMLSTGTLVDLLGRVEELQREMRDLRGKIELQTYELSQLKARQRELYLDVDGRLQRIEQGAVAAVPAPAATTAPATATAPTSPATATTPAAPATPATPAVAATPATPPVATTEPAAPAVDPLKEQADYQAAFNLLKAARYDDAAKALTEFLQRYPDGSYSDNAQYWLGESYYVTRKFPQALAEFEKLIARFPSSQKYTHALLKIGYIHDEMGNRAEAIRVLDDLIKRFPSSAAAGLAKKRLERLR